jgi:starvation-inducible outer membrane lipoprotein
MCLAAALLLTGCVVNPDLFCDIVDKAGPTPSHQCNELHSLDATQAKDAEDACPKLGGAVVDSCSTEGQIGVCSLSVDGIAQKIHFYGGGSLTAAEHEATCKQLMGTWTGS